MKKKKENEILVYDLHDTTSYIDRNKRVSLASLGIELPPETPTKSAEFAVADNALE